MYSAYVVCTSKPNTPHNIRAIFVDPVLNAPELWNEYGRLRREVKELVREKKLTIWNEVVEKVNVDFDGSRKEFWAFVGRRTKGKKKNITSLKSDTGVSVTCTRGKLEVLQSTISIWGRLV